MRTLLSCVFVLIFASVLHSAEPTTNDRIAILYADWKNPDRANEAMPIKIYYPKAGDGPWPVVIVSHGLGGSREGLKYIGENWAAHGYVSVHLQHVGSDQSVIARGLGEGKVHENLMQATTPEQLIRRIGDVRFSLDQIAKVNVDKTSPLFKKLDLDRIAMAGHSYGAVTTQAMCGQLMGPRRESVYDPRIKCGIIFSPSAPKLGDPKAAFSKIAIPTFHWTGTKDESPLRGDTKPIDRRVPFDSITFPNTYLVVLTDGDHGIYNGRVRGLMRQPNDAAWSDLIERGTTAFLDAYLKRDAKALQFLKDGEFAAAVKKYGTFEQR